MIYKIFAPLESPGIYSKDDIDKSSIPHDKRGVRAPSFLTGFALWLIFAAIGYCQDNDPLLAKLNLYPTNLADPSIKPAVSTSLKIPLYCYNINTKPFLMNNFASKNQGLFFDITDEILAVPDFLLTKGIRLFKNMQPARDFSWTTYKNESLTERMLSLDIYEPGSPSRSDRLIKNLIKHEYSFFKNFTGNYLNTPAYELQLTDIDSSLLSLEQRKIAIDTVRHTYGYKFKIVKAPDVIKSEGFSINKWQKFDFIFVPPALGAYMYLRGLDKEFKIKGTRLKFYLEPLSRVMTHIDSERELRAAGGFELDFIAGFKLISSFGIYNGDLQNDFIGIGTDFGIAKKTVALNHAR